MALIKCPNCGKQISDRALACPQCGVTKEEINAIFAERERKAAERERLRKVYEARVVEEMRIRAEKEAEKARIRVDKRKLWWQKHIKYFFASLLSIIVLVAVLFASMMYNHRADEKRKYEESIALAQSYIAKGDSCLSISQLNVALSLYNEAFSCTQDAETRKLIQKKQDEVLKMKMGE